MKPQALNHRTVHLIDIENLCETTFLNEGLVREVKDEYLRSINPKPQDLFVLGVSHFNLEAAVFGWGAGVAQYVVQSGLNGADLALLGVLGEASMIDRFTEVVIASGDGIFAEAGTRLRRSGLKVGFVGRTGAISYQIVRSGCSCLELPSIRQNAEEFDLVS